METQQFYIDEHILAKNFSDFDNYNFIKIDENTSYDYGISYHYNYYFPPESGVAFRFMDNNVSKAAFAVKEDGNEIEQVILYLEVFDLDFFYEEMVEKFGKPETKSLSKSYLEKHGYKVPNETKNFNENSYDSIPYPQIKDYKNLRNINWYEVDDGNTNIIVRNQINMKTQVNETQVIFIKTKEFE